MAFKKFRKMKVYEASGYNYKRTPSIILKGDWLKETGFDIGGLIQVECENGKLIITQREPEMVEYHAPYTKECIELKPGTDGVTEAWIKTLHSLDDHEVYLNCKNGHLPLTDAEKAAKRKWEREHEGETYGVGWNLSLDHMVTDDEGGTDKSSVLKSACYMMDEDVPADVQHLRDLVETMTEKQQLVYKLHILEGYSFTEIAKLMGTSIPNVKKHYDKAILFIKNNF